MKTLDDVMAQLSVEDDAKVRARFRELQETDGLADDRQIDPSCYATAPGAGWNVTASWSTGMTTYERLMLLAMAELLLLTAKGEDQESAELAKRLQREVTEEDRRKEWTPDF